MSPIIKAVFLVSIAVFVVESPPTAIAAPLPACSQTVQDINDLATNLARGASSYWAHRKNFIELKYGPSSLKFPDAPQRAAMERVRANPFKAGMPNSLASLKALLATAQSQHCLSLTELSAIADPAIKHAQRINFDQFPPDTPTEGPAKPAPPRMPTN
jgi:hypothetical protein